MNCPIVIFQTRTFWVKKMAFNPNAIKNFQFGNDSGPILNFEKPLGLQEKVILLVILLARMNPYSA